MRLMRSTWNSDVSYVFDWDGLRDTGLKIANRLIEIEKSILKPSFVIDSIKYNNKDSHLTIEAIGKESQKLHSITLKKEDKKLVYNPKAGYSPFSKPYSVNSSWTEIAPRELSELMMNLSEYKSVYKCIGSMSSDSLVEYGELIYFKWQLNYKEDMDLITFLSQNLEEMEQSYEGS